MKYAFAIIAFCFLTVFPGFSQSAADDVQKPNAEMTVLFRDGNFDEANSIGERIVKLQRNEKPLKSQNLVNALENLAQIKVARFKTQNARINSPNAEVASLTEFEHLQKDAKDAETLFREAIGLARTNQGSGATLQLIGLKNSVAWILANYLPPEQSFAVGFDKSSRDRFDSINREKFYKRINEAESLYLDAMKDAESSVEPEGDAALAARFNLAEFELSKGDFETAIPEYEKSIAVVEKRYGKKSQNLLPPMRSYMNALAATGQDDRAFEILSRIVMISGKAGQMPKALLNVSLRSEKAFATSNSPAVEQRANANKATAELGGKASVVLAGNGAAAAQSASTFGLTYYENSHSVKLIKIPVRVVVGENDKILEAEGLTSDKENNAEAEKIVRGWTFRPLKLGQQPFKVKGYVDCLFLTDRFSK